MYRDLVKEVEKKAHQNLHELKTSFAVAGSLPRSRESSLQRSGGRFWKGGDEMYEKKHDTSNLSNCSTALKSNPPWENGLAGGMAVRRGSGTLLGSPKHSDYLGAANMDRRDYDFGASGDLGQFDKEAVARLREKQRLLYEEKLEKLRLQAMAKNKEIAKLKAAILHYKQGIQE